VILRGFRRAGGSLGKSQKSPAVRAIQVLIPEISSMSEQLIREFDPADCKTADGNRLINDSDLAGLLSSMRSDGQRVPGLNCLHPALPGKYLTIAGNGRKRCCEILGIPFRAELIDRPLKHYEIIRIRVPEHVHRKNPSPFDLCRDVCDYKEERGLKTWTEVGADLSLPAVTMSRIISVRRIPSELRPLAEQVCPSVCWLIAPVKNPDAMKRAFDFAARPGPDGKLPSRDAMAKFIDTLKDKKRPKTARPRILKGSIDGRPIQIGIMPDDSTDAVIEWLKALASRLGKYRDLPPDNLGSLFGR
jgi:hypothetical protein